MLHFRHTKMFPNSTPTMTSQAIVSYLNNLKLFSSFTEYMSLSHGYSTMGGIEYDDGDCVEKTKKEKASHQLGISTGYGDAHQLMST